MIKQDKTLAHKNPALSSQWDFVKNDKTPQEVTSSSSYQAWWKCPTCEYSWKTSVNNRAQGKGCPSCAGKVVIPGINDIATTHPEYTFWWDDETTPTTLSYGSRKNIQWKCPQNHTFIQPIKRFAMKCPQCIQKTLNHHKPELNQDWSENNNFTINDISYNSAKTVEWDCAKCHYVWNTPAYQRANGTGCPMCSSRSNTSQQEEEINSFLENEGLIQGTDYKRHARKMFQGKYEVDFYFPQQKIAIEYNGLYWHSETKRSNRYHYDKWKACQELGIQLITIWEDDYLKNPQLIHTMLAHKIGIAQQKKVFARQTKVVEIEYSEAERFLNKNHIQGNVQGSNYLGLFSKEKELVAVTVWTQRGNKAYLERYATSRRVIGGLGKILSYYLKSRCEGIEQIITFAAHDVSNGNLYETLGFVADKELKPDYSYIVNKKRIHKFNYRIKRFREDPHLLYQEGLTETQLASLNKILRIWDCGKTRYVLDVDNTKRV